jgi:hypothetical protein
VFFLSLSQKAGDVFPPAIAGMVVELHVMRTPDSEEWRYRPFNAPHKSLRRKDALIYMQQFTCSNLHAAIYMQQFTCSKCHHHSRSSRTSLRRHMDAAAATAADAEAAAIARGSRARRTRAHGACTRSPRARAARVKA